MKRWLLRYNPRSWIQRSPEEAKRSPRYGLHGPLLNTLVALFFLSSLTLAMEFVLYGDNEVYQRASANNQLIFVVSLLIAVGVFTHAWWTRYFAYCMLALTLSNLLLFADSDSLRVSAEPDQVFFWTMVGLLLVRDVPLCLYLTGSRRARLTFENQAFLPGARLSEPSVGVKQG